MKGAWASVDLNFKTGTDGTLVAATPDGLRLASESKDANGQVNAGAARASKNYNYRPSFYVHSAKLNAMQAHFSSRYGWD